MTALGVGAIVFACVFAGAVFGMVLSSILPKEHLSENAKDVLKVTMAMIATLAALVLGLLTASAKSSLDDKENAVRSWAAETLLLDRTLAQYGPEAQGARDLLKQVRSYCRFKKLPLEVRPEYFDIVVRSYFSMVLKA